jgi:AraC-like DNA-binding protein
MPGGPDQVTHEVNAQSERLRGTFTLDRTTLAEPGTREAFQARIGRAFVFPEFDLSPRGDDRIHVQATRVHDFATTAVSFAPQMRSARLGGEVDDLAWLYVVDHGSWTVGEPGDRESRTVAAGGFMLRHVGRHLPSRTAPGTRARVTMLPSNLLRALPRDRVITGPTNAAEVRMLMAHTRMIQETVTDLGPAGVRAAHGAAIALVNAVAQGVVDGGEPYLASSLARAAMTLATRLLHEPELSSEVLARQLRVSRRTLQRAFAREGMSVAGYVRDQRLEAVRRALDAPHDRPSVTELAARWQFADSSHLTRAFKRRFGLTPSEYVRRAGGRQGAGGVRDGTGATHEVASTSYLQAPGPPRFAPRTT